MTLEEKLENYFDGHFGRETYHTTEKKGLQGEYHYRDYHLDEYDNMIAENCIALAKITTNFRIMVDGDHLMIRIYL